MQKTKYDELVEKIEALEKSANMKQEAVSRSINSIMMFLKHGTLRTENIVKLCAQAGTFTEETFEQMMDRDLGMRQKDPGEAVAIGDTAWVSYVATIAGVDSFHQEDENMPVRVGSNAVVFETHLVGKTTGEETKFEVVMKEGDHAGKTVTFMIKIKKVKTKL